MRKDEVIIRIINRLDEAYGNLINLKVTIVNANTSKSNLDTSITNSDTAKSNLDGSISTANATKTGLDGSISTGNNLKDELDAIISGTDYEQVTLDLAKVKEDIDFQVSSAKPSKEKMWFELLN